MNINIEDFISFLTIKKNLAPQSIRHCKIRFNVVDRWLNGRQLTKELVEQFFYEKKKAGQGNNSLNTYYFFFNQLQDYFQDRGFSGNFMAGFKSFKKTKSQINIFSQEEIKALLGTHIAYSTFQHRDVGFLDEMFITFTMLLAFTGCRFSEATNIKVQDLDLANGKATIKGAKTYEFRTIYLTEPLLTKLEKRIKNKSLKDYVFNNSMGKPLSPQDYDRDLKMRAKLAGVTKRVFPHNFRHTYITNLLEVGVPITEVATLVGHKDIQTTYNTYMHLADQTLKKAALRHPMVRQSVDPKYLLESLKDVFINYHLETDSRFKYELTEENGRLFIDVQIV
jgi:site-specific recombinase XerD